MSDIIVSKVDDEHLKIIRRNIVHFMKHVAKIYASRKGRLLDIAPQDHEGARPFFSIEINVDTFDLDPDSGRTYIGDITKRNESLDDNTYEYVVCTEVLEHTLQPFDALAEIWRILKPGGMLFLSVPFNLRIHGPLPDCWRFTEHGLRTLLRKFVILELNTVETPDRPLMPVHYTVVAKKSVQLDSST